MNETAKD